MPRVSILIPLHNCESTIRRSLDSVYAQDFEDFEIIAILNNCTDNTESILLEYSDRKQPIKTFYCKVPGIVPTLNTGIPHCTGEFIARQDGDDMWYPTKLRKQVEFLDANSNIDIVGTQMRQVNAEGKPIQASLVHPTEDLQRDENISSNQFKASVIQILDLNYLQHYEENRIADLIFSNCLTRNLG